eukprot:9510946-Ditylum_brightwellii.AAC.1
MYEGWIVKYARKFYQEQEEALLDKQELHLSKEDVHRLEHCRGKAQKIIVASHFLQHDKWLGYYNKPSGVPLPTSSHARCQGKPGT